MSDQGYSYAKVKGLTEEEKTIALTDICLIIGRQGEDRKDIVPDLEDYIRESIYKTK